MVTGEHERIGEPVPAEVQARELTRTEKSIQRLAEHNAEALVEVIDAPNGPFHRDTHPTVPLVVLTPAGREHYTCHRSEYQRTNPETDLPHPTHHEKPGRD